MKSMPWNKHTPVATLPGGRGTNTRPDARPERIKLPVEVMDMVLAELSPRDRLRAAFISRTWASAALDAGSWEKLGAPAKGVTYAQLHRATRQDAIVQKASRATHRFAPYAAVLVGAIPGAVWLPVHFVTAHLRQVSCIEDYCRAYEGPNYDGFQWSSHGAIRANGSDPDVYDECREHFGDPFVYRYSGPYGQDGECKMSVSRSVMAVGVSLLIGMCLVASIGLAARRGRQTIERKHSEDTLELGLRTAPAEGSLAETVRKLTLLGELGERLTKNVSRGRMGQVQKVLALDIAEDIRQAIMQATLHQAVVTGRHFQAYDLILLGAKPSVATLVASIEVKHPAAWREPGNVQVLLDAARDDETNPHPSDALPTALASDVLRRACEPQPMHLVDPRRQACDIAVVGAILSAASDAARAAMIDFPVAEDGRTMLHLSTCLEDADLFEQLLRHGGDVHVRDAAGKTVLDLIADKADFRYAYRLFQRDQTARAFDEA